MSYARIVPLGGLGEIGMNCMAIETPEGILVVDCGVMFPHDQLGIDVIHPDFSYLWNRREDVLGVLITHGHEDHVGALPYLLRQIPVPVWGPPYALTLARHRLSEHPEVPVPDLRPMLPRQRFKIGALAVEPLRVTHSIPDALALAIDTPAGRIFHTGDFKLEEAPIDGQPSDEERFRELGDEGVDLLLSDSTNVDVEGFAGRERDVAQNLHPLIARAEGRVVVVLFASNVFRIQSLLEIASRTGRRACYLGRSVVTHARAAQDLGRLPIHTDLVVPSEQAMLLPSRELLAIASGSQAEPASGIARLARGDHPKLKLEKGDTVIFSSRAIPGNERAVFDVICQLERRGCHVHFRGSEGELHASGHGGRPEQRRMMELIRPRSFVPVHGTYHHLRRHADLAREMGVKQVALIENGQSLRWSDGALGTADNVRTGRVAVDEGIELSDEVLGQRASMAQSGAVFATIMLTEKGTLLGTPQVVTAGVVTDDPPEVVAEAARVAISESIRIARGVRDVLPPKEAEEAARRALRRMYRVGDKRPVVVVEIAPNPEDDEPPP